MNAIPGASDGLLQSLGEHRFQLRQRLTLLRQLEPQALKGGRGLQGEQQQDTDDRSDGPGPGCRLAPDRPPDMHQAQQSERGAAEEGADQG